MTTIDQQKLEGSKTRDGIGNLFVDLFILSFRKIRNTFDQLFHICFIR